MDLYGKILRDHLFPMFETRVRKRPTVLNDRYLAKTQWLTREELRAHQMGLLHKLLRHAYNTVPFYRDRFQAAGITPSDIRSLEDLAKLPVLERHTAQSAVEQRTSTAPPYAAITKQTSGTTGMPMPVAYNAASEDQRQAMRRRGYGWAGYEMGARTLHYWSPDLRDLPPRQRFKRWLDLRIKREHYFDCAVRSDEHLQSVVDFIKHRRPEVINGFTQAVAELARYVLRTNQRDWGTIPVVCCAERLFAPDRTALEAAFGPEVFETYGCREFMLIGTECDQHDGLHVSMENLIVEIVVGHGNTARPAEPGETGDVVITELHNIHQPFIRYAGGDRAVARPPEQCACGRWLDRIGPIEGRVTETVRDGAGNPVTGLTFSVMIADIGAAAKQFQVVQHVDQSITLKLVPSKQLTQQDLDRLQNHCRRYLVGVPVTVETVEDIPVTPAGKRRLVVVEKQCAAPIKDRQIPGHVVSAIRNSEVIRPSAS